MFKRITNYSRTVLFVGLFFIARSSFDTAQAQTEPGPTIMTHHETIPNPVYNSGFRVATTCQSSTQPCYWDDPNTWQMQTVPDQNTLVIIDGNVQIRDQSAVAQSVGVYPGGELSFAPYADTRLKTADLLVLDGGTLQIGTMADPIGGLYLAELIFRDLPFDAVDSSQHLRGLLAIDGVVRMFGHALDDVFLRTAIEPEQGDSEITMAQSVLDAGWRMGHSVVLPTSQQCERQSGTCPDESENRVITAISADGLTITLNEPLQFDHPGARDHAGVLDFTPHVINKSRNVVLRSENPDGVRGHLLFHGRADVDMRYAEIRSLGRTDIRDLGPTNQKGRYPVHAHHLIGPETAQTTGYQFAFIGNVIDFGQENDDQDRKWGISIHGSHYGLIEQNIVDYASGAAIVTESGSETGNMFRENFVVRVIGGNGARTEDRDPSDNSKSGRAGTGYWFNGGGSNYYEKNVVAAIIECVYCYGFKFDNVRNGDLLFPTVQGADPHIGGGYLVSFDTVGINHFKYNEAYAVPNGLTVWWACTYGEWPTDNCNSRIDSFHLWHHHRWGYHGYPSNNITLADFVIRGDPTVLANRYEAVMGIHFSDYFHRNLLIENADVQNVRTAINMSSHRDERGATGSDVGVSVIKDSYLVAPKGVRVWAPASVNGADDLAPQTTILRNVRFDIPINVDLSGQEQAYIIMEDTSNILNDDKTNYELRNDLWVYNYNGAPGEDGDNLYIIPTYHGTTRCDDTIGICDSEMTAGFDYIDKGHVYPLRDAGVPTAVTLQSSQTSEQHTALLLLALAVSFIPLCYWVYSAWKR